MRLAIILYLAVCLMGSAAEAQVPLSFPPGAEAREGALLSRAGPATRRFIAGEAAREAGMGTVADPVARAAVAKNASALGAVSDADVDALVMLVMMQATRDADAELRDQMANLQQLTAKKQGTRASVASAKASEASARAAAEAEYARLKQTGGIAPSTTLDGYLASHSTAATPRPPRAGASAPMAVPPADASLSDATELNALRLKALTDRRAKSMEELSSILKRMSDKDRNLVDNLK